LAFLVLSVGLLFATPQKNDCGCPKPPATTSCDENQAAICRSVGRRCEGKCVTHRNQVNAFDFAGNILTLVFNREKELTAGDIRDQPKTFEPIISSLITSAQTGKLVTLKLDNANVTVCIGLSNTAIGRLIEARDQLRR
jgi:hypothetical protein